MNDLITIMSSALPEVGTRVIGFRGVEAISKPYELEIFVSLEGAEGDELDLGDGIGAKAKLIIDRIDDKLPPFIFAGVLAGVDLLHAVEGRSLVRLVLVPRLHLLSLSRHSRIFTKMSVPDVIEAVLSDNGFSSDDYELRLGSYETEEHITQYRESDLDFISRWMEREGIYYYFLHSEEGEKLILADNKAYEEDALGVPVYYFPQLGHDRSAGASFRSFIARHRTLPSSIKLKDYDYARPNLALAGSAAVSPFGSGEVNLYGERFFSPSAGERLAKLRAEEMLAREVVYHGAGTRSHIRPGAKFDLDEHPRPALNTTYLAITVHHFGNQAAGNSAFKSLMNLEHDDVYFCEVDAIPSKVQFRAESRTQWPRIFGFENGTVDGPADSEYAQIDDQGRYAVKFKFDESNLKDGRASTFVRMMQPHGGGIEGFHFPLRKFTEVVLSFLGGDPDRPVISGVTPNALTPSPVTSGNHTLNVVQTGGRNRFELEDRNGQQRVTLSTPHENSYVRMGYPNARHHMIIYTNRNTILNAGEDFDLRVGQIQGSGTWDALIKNNWKTHVEDGGVSLGVVLDALPPEAGKYKLEAQSDIGMHTTTGNYSLNVDTGTWVTNVDKNTTWTVKTGNTKIDTQTGTTQILSKGKVTVDSTTNEIDVHAQKKIYVHSTTGQVYVKADANEVKIEGQTNVHIQSHGPMSILAHGEITQEAKQKWYARSWGDFVKLNFSMGVNFTVGMTSDTKIGVFNDNMIGGKMELTLAVKAAVSLALSLECNMGLVIKNKVGPAELQYSNVSIRNRAVTLEGTMGPKLKSAVAFLNRGPVHITVP